MFYHMPVTVLNTSVIFSNNCHNNHMWLHIAITPDLEMRKLRYSLKADFDQSQPTEPPYYRNSLLYQTSTILFSKIRQL